MTDHDDTHASIDGRLQQIEAALHDRDMFGLATEETPQFEIGQEVLVIDEVRKLFVQEVKRCVNHDEYRCGQPDGTPWCWYKAGQLMAVPKPTPQFAIGQRVLIKQEGLGQGLKGRIEVCQRVENARKGDWHYLVWCGDNVALWVFGVDLELADEAPRQELPDTPPPYKAPDGTEVAMRWVRGEDGEVVRRQSTGDEYRYDPILKRVLCWGHSNPTVDPFNICEPVPVVQGWNKEWIRLWIKKDTGLVFAVEIDDVAWPTESDEDSIYISVRRDALSLPPIPIPEVPNA